jgi:gamma-F420-2:alpha-L-glutamate ligase
MYYNKGKGENLQAWLIYSEKDVQFNEQYIQLYFEEGKKLGIEFYLLLAENLQLGIKEGKLLVEYFYKEINTPDFAICRTIYPLLSKQLELIGIKVFNNATVADICNDKAKTYQYVAQSGIRMVDTYFCKKNFLNNQIMKIEDNTIVKSVSGHGGQEVFLWNKEDNENILDRIKDKDTVIQALIGESHKDLRVYVIGNQIVGAVLRTAQEGFKSNFSLGGKVELYHLTKEESGIVNSVIQLFYFGLVGIDFLIDNNGELVFNEIEDVVGSRMLFQCSDINIVRLYLEFIITRLSISIPI